MSGISKGKDRMPTTQSLGGASSNNAPAADDIKSNIRLLEQLFKSFSSLRCHGRTCQAPLRLGSFKDHITNWCAAAHGSQPRQISWMCCSRCKKNTCIGCGKVPVRGAANVTTEYGIVSNCCDRGKLFGLWMLLARFDQVELQPQAPVAPSPPNPVNQLANRFGFGSYGSGPGVPIDIDSNNPYSTAPYQSSKSGISPFQAVPESKIKEKNATIDQYLRQTLILLTTFLPNSHYNSKFDQDPPAEVLALFRLTSFLDRVSALVRNDSVDDMAQRTRLYEATFEFVTAIAAHPGLVRMATEKRPGKIRYPGLSKISEGSSLNSDRSSSFDGSARGMVASIVTSCHDTHRQATSYVEMASKATAGTEFSSTDSKIALSICKRIVDFYKAIDLTAPVSLSHPTASDKDVWTQFHEENRVAFTNDVLNDHMFHSEFSQVIYSRPGRMPALQKEIANLTTSLPPGIFLKIAESRLDVMKALIFGVEGSPYAGGLFIFDIFLPSDWPSAPPKVHCVLDEGLDRRQSSPTTGMGGLNPNVHTDGKVCLSLLNTWSGSPSERWQPNKSTLLSVFVSIQSMIFGAKHPWLNEPGNASAPPTSLPSVNYTKNVQCKTVKYAMLWWLSSDKAKKGVWGEVSEIYWAIKGLEVLKMVREWEKANEFLRKYDKNVPPSGRVPPNNPYDARHGNGGGSGAGLDLVRDLENKLGFGEVVDNKSSRGQSGAGTGANPPPYSAAVGLSAYGGNADDDGEWEIWPEGYDPAAFEDPAAFGDPSAFVEYF